MLTHQFPLERYPSDEGWTVVETGGIGGQVTSINESLSGRGSKCVTLDKSATSKLAYIKRNLNINPGEWFSVSFYVRKRSCNSEKNIFSLDASDTKLRMYFNTNATSIYIRGYNDAGSAVISSSVSGVAAVGQVLHVAIAIKRASGNGIADGEVYWLVNSGNVQHYSNIANFNKLSVTSLIIGTFGSTNNLSFDVDEIRFGTRITDVLPSGVTPPMADGELPQPVRTIVLFNQNSADSKTFAQSIAGDESLLCPLPCSTAETLADYQSFISEVEHPVKNFLAFQPMISAQATCIIAGYNVPGFFTDNGVQVPAVSRLADIDNNFSANKTNPLCGTSARLTANVLQTMGLRLAARLDANTITDCNTIKTLGGTAITVATGEKYFTTQTPLVDEQMLRLPFETISDDTEIFNDAIVYYTQAIEGWSIDETENNSRLAIIDSVNAGYNRSDISQYLLSRFRSIISAGEDFDISAFCRMLLNGGTIAEAFAVAAKKFNSTSQLVAWPFMTVNFPKAGYNIYFGKGSQANVDYSQIYAALSISATEFEVKIPHKPSSVRAMCIRKVSSDGLEETRGRGMMLEANSSGLIHQQLPTLYDLTARNTGGGKVELSFRCLIRDGQAQPLHFEILGDDGSGEINRITPAAVVQFVQGEREYAAIVEAANRPAKFTVRARRENFSGDEATPVTIMPHRIPVKPKVQI